jgi:hypothetical protein
MDCGILACDACCLVGDSNVSEHIASFLNPEDGDGMSFQNVGNHLQD